ncbi:MAG: ABC transporter permease, partial [Gemmatimonadetes bacterium]|nr:ABC transporter permease [Gemmatimonadota bacterium]
IADELVAEFGNENRGAFVEPLESHLRGELTSVLTVLLAGVSLLFILACFNAANLITARSGAKLHGAAVRNALGASQGRLLRGFLVEGVFLSGIALVLGLALTFAGLPWFLRLVPAELLVVSRTEIDSAVLLLSSGLALATGVAFGLIPFLHLKRTGARDLLASASGAGRVSARLTGRQTLVGAQLGLAVLLMVPAVMLGSSLRNLRDVETGFTTENRLRASYNLPSTAYPRDFSVWPMWPEILEFNRELARRVNELPGVVSAAIALDQPLAPGVTNSFRVAGRQVPESEPQEEVPVRFVSPDYFETVGSSLTDGRGFDTADGPETPFRILLNQKAAETLFPGGDAIGQEILIWGSRGFRVVGIVENERFYGLREAEPPALYLNLNQIPPGPTTLSILVHASGRPEALVRPIREALRSLDPSIAAFDIRTMDETVAESIAVERFASVVFTTFATVSLLISVLGVFGIVSFLAAVRRHELGIRLALGADPNLIRTSLVSAALPMILVGTFLGAAGAAAVSGLLRNLLFGVDALGTVWYAFPALGLVGIAVLASFIPAVRASRDDPVRLLFADRS